MRARSALLVILVSCVDACAARQTATPGEVVEPRDATGVAQDGGAPPMTPAARDAADAGLAPIDAGAASENWLAAPAGAPLFAARLLRESGKLDTFEFASPDGRYSGSVLAASKPRVQPAKDKMVPVLQIPIGAAHPIACALFDGEMHPAQRLRFMLENLAKKRAVAGLAVVDVRAVAGAPLLTLDVLSAPLPGAPIAGRNQKVLEAARALVQKVGEAGDADAGVSDEPMEAALGARARDPDAGTPAPIATPAPAPEPSYDEVKIAILARGQASLICTHDGAGDRRTFERVVESAAATVSDSSAAKRVGPRSALLQAVRSEGKLIGYRHHRIYPPRADGSRIELLSAPRFDRADDGSIVESDVEVTEKRAANGELRHGEYAVTRAGAFTQLTLEEEPDGSYAVHGSIEGKPLEQSMGTIKGAKGLRRPTPEQLAQIVSGAKAELVFDDYSPLAPLQLILSRVQRGTAPDQLVVKSSTGEDQQWTVDEHGVVQKIEQRGADGAPETIERIWAWGGL